MEEHTVVTDITDVPENSLMKVGIFIFPVRHVENRRVHFADGGDVSVEEFENINKFTVFQSRSEIPDNERTEVPQSSL